MIQLRPFAMEDIPALFELFRGTILRVNSRDYSAEQVQAWAPASIDAIRWATLAERFTGVATVQGQIAGFTDLEATGHIDRFFVHADFQRQGVGAAMMQAVVEEARRQNLTQLDADVSITARPFFEQQGFRVLAEQDVILRGVSFRNYRMERRLSPRSGPGSVH